MLYFILERFTFKKEINSFKSLIVEILLKKIKDN